MFLHKACACSLAAALVLFPVLAEAQSSNYSTRVLSSPTTKDGIVVESVVRQTQTKAPALLEDPAFHAKVLTMGLQIQFRNLSGHPIPEIYWGFDLVNPSGQPVISMQPTGFPRPIANGEQRTDVASIMSGPNQGMSLAGCKMRLFFTTDRAGTNRHYFSRLIDAGIPGGA